MVILKLVKSLHLSNPFGRFAIDKRMIVGPVGYFSCLSLNSIINPKEPIDGIGIFPNQEKELIEMDTSKQLSHVVDLFAKIPQHINVFIIPIA